MRILQVIQELETGGAEQVVLGLRSRLSDRGDEVFVASATGPRAAERGLPDAVIPIVGRRPVAVLNAARAVRAAIRAVRPDVVHAHNPTMALLTGLATLRGRTVPAVTTCHGVPDADYPATAKLLRLAGIPVIGCGPGVTAALQERSLRGVRTVLNGITPAPDPVDRAALTAELCVPVDAPLVVTVGRLAPQKNQALAIRAIAELDTATLVLVGDGELRSDLEQLARDLGVTSRVRFTGARPDARAMLGAADVAVLSSAWEGLPLVALEAFAAGVPLVATGARGVRELVTDGSTGLLVAPGDHRALGAAIERVLGDDGLRRRLAAAASDIAARHSEQAMADEYRTIYEEVAR